MSFLSINNILYEHQYGFRPKHSIIHPLLHLVNTLAKADNVRPKEMTLTILCDSSKAFEVINHGMLIRKLQFYGTRGIVKEWVIKCLKDRAQYVQIDSHMCEKCTIKCGVPQGSNLWPLLYLVYGNDIANRRKAKVVCFADDTSLCISDANRGKLFDKANIEINKLCDWFSSNRLCLNARKIKYIIIRSPRNKCYLTGRKAYVNDIAIWLNRKPLNS